MARGVSGRAPWIVWAVLAAGAAWYAAAIGQDANGTLTQRNIEIALAVAVVAYLALHVDPAWLISAGIAICVFNGNWEHMGLGSVTAAPDRLLLAAGIGALLFRIPPQAKDRPPIRTRPEYWLLAAAGLYVVLSAIAVGTIGQNAAFFRMIDRFGLLPFFMFAVAPVAFRTRRQRRILLGALIVTGAYVGFVTWAEAFKADAFVWPKYILDDSVGITHGRGRGPFAAADADGLALLSCAAAALVGFREWRPNWVRILCFGVAMVCLAGTFLTLTRSVWIGTAVAGVVTMVVFSELRPYTIFAIVGAYAAVTLSLAAIPGLAKRADERQHDQRPVWDRRNSNAAALRMLGDRPLLGFGWNEYQARNSDYFVQARDYPLSGQKYPLHNVYLSYAVELGAVGVAVWLIAAAAAIGGAIFRRGPPEMRPWRMALLAMTIQWLVVSALAPAPYAFPNLLLWTWAGVASGLLPEQAAVARAALRPRRLQPSPT